MHDRTPRSAHREARYRPTSETPAFQQPGSTARSDRHQPKRESPHSPRWRDRDPRRRDQAPTPLKHPVQFRQAATGVEQPRLAQKGASGPLLQYPHAITQQRPHARIAQNAEPDGLALLHRATDMPHHFGITPQGAAAVAEYIGQGEVRALPDKRPAHPPGQAVMTAPLTASGIPDVHASPGGRAASKHTQPPGKNRHPTAA